MGTVPVVKSWVDGDKPPYTDWANLSEATRFLLNPPRVKLRQTVAQPMNTATWYNVTFDTEEIDTDGMHSTIISNHIITPKTPGLYKGWYMVSWAGLNTAADLAGDRRTQLYKNGVAQLPLRSMRPETPQGQYYQNGPVRFFTYCNGTTDTLAVGIWHSSGTSPMNTYVTQYIAQSQFYLRWYAVS